MWWPFRMKRKPEQPEIPPYQPPPVVVRTSQAPEKDTGIEVEEIDTSAMTRTGVHKAWRKLTGQDPK